MYLFTLNNFDTYYLKFLVKKIIYSKKFIIYLLNQTY